jgi:2-dehydropantoate 2-reductase
MKFAVMGAGEFGGRYGGLLVTAGLNVTFIARGQRYAEIKRHGLHIPLSAQGRKTDIDHVQVTDTPSEVGPVDVVIFAVKNYHLEEAAAQITPLLGEATVVLPMQNGPNPTLMSPGAIRHNRRQMKDLSGHLLHT